MVSPESLLVQLSIPIPDTHEFIQLAVLQPYITRLRELTASITNQSAQSGSSYNQAQQPEPLRVNTNSHTSHNAPWDSIISPHGLVAPDVYVQTPQTTSGDNRYSTYSTANTEWALETPVEPQSEQNDEWEWDGNAGKWWNRWHRYHAEP